MRSLRDIGKTDATILWPWTSPFKHPSGSCDASTGPEVRATSRFVAEGKHFPSGSERILALPRNYLQPPIQRDLSQNRLPTFMTSISAGDKDEEKRLAAEYLIFASNAEQPVDIEVWTDGSVGETPGIQIRLIDGESVSVKWDEGRYTAPPTY